MLRKLIKYDFKWINSVMYIYFIIMILITIAVKIIESFEQTLFLVIVDKIASCMFIGCAVSILITCIMRIWHRTIQNVYKDESYLTHTLPITKNQIYNSKVIAGILSLLLSVLVVLICVAFVYLNSNTIDMLKAMWQSLVDVYSGGIAVLFIIGMIFLIFLELLFFMMTGIFSIVIGYCSNSYKTIKAIIVGIASYGIFNTISLVILGVLSQVASFEIVNGGFPDIKTLKIMGITAISLYILCNLIYYQVGKHILNKGVNIE